MKILIIPSWYPSKANPLSGSFFREQAIALANSGHTVIILNVTACPRNAYKDPNNFKIIKKFDNNIAEYSFVWPTFGLSRIRLINIALFYIRMIITFKNIKNDYNKIDIIHAHSYLPAGTAAIFLGNKYKIPVVITEHDSSLMKSRIGLLSIYLLKFNLLKANAFICVSNSLKNRILAHANINKNIYVIGNMVNPIFDFKEHHKFEKEFIFLSIGSLIKRKNYSKLIDAFVMAFPNDNKIKLYIIGDGPLKSQLHKRINEKRLEGRVRLLGAQPRNNVAEYLKCCNAFILISKMETFGVVYIEALACGKPVIATKNGGSEDIVDNSNGILINKDNIEEIANAMVLIYDNYNKYNSKEISNSCKRKYSSDAVIKKIVEIYSIFVK